MRSCRDAVSIRRSSSSMTSCWIRCVPTPVASTASRSAARSIPRMALTRTSRPCGTSSGTSIASSDGAISGSPSNPSSSSRSANPSPVDFPVVDVRSTGSIIGEGRFGGSSRESSGDFPSDSRSVSIIPRPSSASVCCWDAMSRMMLVRSSPNRSGVDSIRLVRSSRPAWNSQQFQLGDRWNRSGFRR